MPPKAMVRAKWPRVRTQGGGAWSETSSIPGRIGGEAYEAYIREKLTGSYKKQDEAKVTATISRQVCALLNQLQEQAEADCKQDLGNTLWHRIFKEERPHDKAGQVAAEVDVVVQDDCNWESRVGGSALKLYGPEKVVAGTVVEVTVHGGLFYVKCFQLERFLTLYRSAHDQIPVAAAVVVNRKPIECGERWIQALKDYPNLRELASRDCFHILYVPLSVAHTQYATDMGQKDEVIAQKDEVIATKDGVIATLLILLILLILLLALLLSMFWRKAADSRLEL